VSSRSPIESRGQNDPVAEHFRRSCETLSRAADDLNLRANIKEIAEAIAAAFRGGHKLLIAGNGGSAADAQHIAGEFLSRLNFDRNPLPAIALTTDDGVITPNVLLVHALVAQLRVTLQAIADFDQAIAPLAQGHPDFSLFDALPGAGAVFAPRLLVAFGEQRERFTSAEDLPKYAGMAPVTERSGKKSWVHWRLQCPKFLRQTFVEWAAESPRHAFWAQVYYQQQRDKGKAHQMAVHALAFKWLRILFRCWQDHTPYDESVYLQALKRRSAPLLHHVAH